MIWHDRSYKNRPQNLPREVGRIHRDLAAMDEASIDRLSSNLHAIPTAPITTSEGTGAACCCDRVVYVSKDGAGDFDTIQQAIDDINAYETPSATEPWVVYICPGEYTEDVVGIDHVSLIGIGTKRDAVTIIGVDGPTYTCPATNTSCENIFFYLAITDKNNGASVIDATAGGGTIFSNCKIEADVDAAAGMLIYLNGAQTTFEACDLFYNHTTSQAGAQSHYIVDMLDGAVLLIFDCAVSLKWDDVDDSAYFISDMGVNPTYIHVKNSHFVGTAIAAGIIGTKFKFYNGTAPGGFGSIRWFHHNKIYLHNSFGGASPAHWMYDVTGGGGSIIKSFANQLHMDSLAVVFANIVPGDSLDSIMDEVYGILPTVIGGGAIEFVHSLLPGNLHVSKKFVANQNQGNNDCNIRGQADSTLFFTDASTDTIGIGTGAPDAAVRLHIADGTADSKRGFRVDHPPRCRMYNTSNQTIGSGAWTKVLWDTKEYDSDAIGDLVNERITPGVTGYFDISSTILCQNGGRWIIAIYKNGALIRQYWKQVDTVAQSLPIYDTIYSTNTDFFEIYAHQNSGGNLLLYNGISKSWFTVHRKS